MPEQKLAAYCVALSFADGGPLYVNTCIAPSEVAAVGIVTAGFLQVNPVKEPLMGVAVGLLAEGWLDAALRAVRGKLPPGGTAEVVSIVPRPAEAPPQVSQVQPPACPHGTWPAHACVLCDPVGNNSPPPGAA